MVNRFDYHFHFSTLIPAYLKITIIYQISEALIADAIPTSLYFLNYLTEEITA